MWKSKSRRSRRLEEKEETMRSVSISRRSHLFCTNDPSHAHKRTHTHITLL